MDQVVSVRSQGLKFRSLGIFMDLYDPYDTKGTKFPTLRAKCLSGVEAFSSAYCTGIKVVHVSLF